MTRRYSGLRASAPVRRALGALLLTQLIASGTSAFALNPAKALTQYRHEVWASDRGLPQNYVVAVAQTPDGYLWVGTEEGLARFDGIRFTLFTRRNTPALSDHNVQALLVDRGGALWIGTRAGGAVRYKDGVFTRYSTQEGLKSDRVLALAATPDGGVWIGTNGGGVAHVANNAVVEVVTQRQGLSDDRILSLAVDAKGAVWTGSMGGTVDRLENGAPTVIAVPLRAPSGIVGLQVARSGGMWVASSNGELFKYDGGTLTSHTLPAGLRLLALAEDREGSLWIGTNGQGLLRYAGGRLDRLGAAGGLASDVIVTVFEDREGSVWLGTGGGGLARMRDTRFTPFGLLEGLSHDIALATFQDRAARLWVGTYGAGLNRLDSGRFNRVPLGAFDTGIVYALAEGKDGTLWVGGDRGIVGLGPGGARPLKLDAAVDTSPVYALLVDANGALWSGSRNGVSRFDGARWRTFARSEGLDNNYVRALAAGRDGSIWAGTNGGGVSRVRGEVVETFKSEDPLANFVRAVYEDADGNTWVGTSGGGLNLLRDGRFAAITTREGLSDDVVYQILEDESGQLWMSCNKGIFRARRADLLAVAEKRATSVESTLYGTADGMRSAESNGGFQPAGVRARDGSLWFPTIKGLVQIAPAESSRPGVAPTVVIEDVVVNRESADVTSPVAVPAGAGEIEIAYSALALIDSERTRFQYKLDGFNASWVNAGTRRVAVYTNIPPGTYTFRVRATSADRVASARDATLQIQLQPRFYQTPWFSTLSLVAIVATGMLLYRWRLGAAAARERHLAALVSERTAQLEAANLRLQELLLVDPLTEIPNRRAFDQMLETEWRRSQRAGTPLSLLLIDIDHFKALNDAFGHQAGDQCLKRVAGVLRRAAGRAGDHPSRYGGEEFALLVPQTDAPTALVIAERLQQAVATEAIEAAPGEPKTLTLSIGVATAVGSQQHSPESLIAAADAALYSAKRLGRNRIEVAEVRHGAP